MTLNQFEGAFMQSYKQCYMILAAARLPSNDIFVGKFES